MSIYSLVSYRWLISELISNGNQAVRLNDKPTNGFILRHDVDYSPTWAVRIAEINAELGICATFFFLVNSPLYNLFTEDCQDALNKITAYGHDVGLHFCCLKGTIQAGELEQAFEILRTVAPKARRCIAWHNPESDLQPFNAVAKSAGFVSVYDSTWFGPDRYISDSNLRHTPVSILAGVKKMKAKTVQILLHPLFWYLEGDHMEEIMRKAWQEKLAEMDRAFGENRLWPSIRKQASRVIDVQTEKT